MADTFNIQPDYDSQGDLSQDYAGWLAEHLHDFADVIAWHLVTHQGWDVDDALLVKDALIAGAFDLSDLFTAANLNAKKVDELGVDFDPETHFELDGSVPSISFTGDYQYLNDLLDPDAGYGPIDLSAFLEEAETTYWTNDTAKGENYHFRGMFTGFVDDQDGYEEGWNDQDEPELNYFTFNFFGEGELELVDSNEVPIPEDHYVDNTGHDDFNGAAAGAVEPSDDLSFTQADGGGGPNNYNDDTQTADNGDPGDPGDPGMDAYEITEDEPGSPYDGIKIVSGGTQANFIVGGSGGDGGAGGNGGSIDVTSTNNANNNELTAGDGGEGGAGGLGGHAIVNGDLNVVIIEGDQDLTILGGDNGAGGAGGEGGDVTVDADGNAQNNDLTAGSGGDGGDGSPGGEGGQAGTTEVDGGNSQTTNQTAGEPGQDGAFVGVTAAFSHSVNVDATAFEGYLTISLSDFVDSLEMGSGGGEIYATLGSDQYILGDGAETIIYTSVDQSDGSTYTDSIEGFDAGFDFFNFSALSTEEVFYFDVVNGDTLEIYLDEDDTPDMFITLLGVDGTITDANFVWV